MDAVTEACMYLQTVNPADVTNHITAVIAAVGALGTAAYGLVDTTKGICGGVSNRGLAYIRKTLTPLLPDTAAGAAGTMLSRDSVFETLKSNWINGIASGDQQSIAKSLIKLRMDAASAAAFAAITGVDGGVLQNVIAKMSSGTALTQPESDTYGRFDLVLSTILGQAYQRADQQYRNTAKLLAIPVSVALSCAGALAMNFWQWRGAHLGIAFAMGVVATPLAPIAKDLSSALQTGVQALQSWKGAI
jgi:hypothetical protein